MTIHFVSLDPETTIPTLEAAKPTGWDTLAFEAAIIDAWAVRWESATLAERDKMIDDLRITLGDKHAMDHR
jgi:hypothetical protein